MTEPAAAEMRAALRQTMRAVHSSPEARELISRRTKDALAAKKAQGVALGGLRAHGAQAREDAIERAEQLRPVFDELAGMSARKIAAELILACPLWLDTFAKST